MIGIAIFGLGRAGKIHSANIMANPRCTIIYAIDPSEEARVTFVKGLATNHAIEVITGSSDKELARIFADDKVHAVFVCSTTGSHHTIARSAIEHGKAVFCEKPISVDLRETEDLYRLAAKKHVLIHCSFNRRYDPQVMEMKTRLDAGELGAVHVVKTCSRDCPCPPIDFLKESGGFFHDCAVHDLDMVCWLVGGFPERVFATATTHDPKIAGILDIDTAVIVLNFPATQVGRPGPIAVIDISRHGSYGYDQRVEVLGDAGMLRSENQQTPSLVWNAPGQTHQGPIMNSFPQRYAQSYVNSLDYFIKSVSVKADLEISAMDVINVSRLAHHCDNSLKSGQPVTFEIVKLDF